MTLDSEFANGLVSAAAAAPSADNMQPWKCRHAPEHTDVWVDEARAGGLSNARYLLSDIALGAVIENMCQFGAACGYEPHVSLFPGGASSPLWVARLRWRPGTDGSSSSLAAAIPNRHTDRRFPFKGSIAEEVRERLGEKVRQSEGVDLAWLSASSKRHALSVMRQAEALRFQYQALHEELFSSIRWDLSWNETASEGLPPGALAVEVPARPLFRSMRRWSVMRSLNYIGGAAFLAMRAAYVPARLSPGLCLIAARRADREGIVNFGRALERFWLQATLDGLAVQPFAAAGVFAQGHIRLDGGFERKAAVIKGVLRDLSPEGHQGLMFVRLGYPPKGSPLRAGRRSPQSFMVSEED